MIPWEALLQAGQISFTTIAQTITGQTDISEYIPLRVRETVMPFQEMATIMPAAQVYAGLVGEEQVPVIYRRPAGAVPATTPTPAVKEVNDGVQVDTSEDANFGGPKFSPKVLQIGTSFSNLAIYQSSGRVESDVLRFIMSELNYEFDDKVLNGPGGANRIRGLLQQQAAQKGTDFDERKIYEFADVTAGAAADRRAMSWAETLEMIRVLQKQRNLMPDGTVPNAYFLMGPTMASRLRHTMRIASVDDNPAAGSAIDNRRMFLIDEDTMGGFTLAGYPVKITNHMPDTVDGTDDMSTLQILFGQLNEIAVGLWGGVQVYYDGISQMGITRVGVQAWMDAQFPRLSAFATVTYKN